MRTNIYPHQWELLASMLTYKVSNGTCLDYDRLGKQDYQLISDTVYNISVDSLQKWFGGRKPAANALDVLCKYVSDIFPYSKWGDLSETENHIEVISDCPDWNTYEQYINAEAKTKNHVKLLKLRHWAFSRTIELANKGIYVIKNAQHKKQEKLIREYSGTYKFFMPGQIPPKKYKKVYVNPLKIDETGAVWMQNAYNKQEFTGTIAFKDGNTLQIILHDSANEGYEYVIFMRIDKYGATAIYYPALVLGYDGQGGICSYPVFLTTDLKLKIESPFVNLYLEECYALFAEKAVQGRMECLSPKILQSLYVKAKQTKQKRTGKK